MIAAAIACAHRARDLVKQQGAGSAIHRLILISNGHFHMFQEQSYRYLCTYSCSLPEVLGVIEALNFQCRTMAAMAAEASGQLQSTISTSARQFACKAASRHEKAGHDSLLPLPSLHQKRTDFQLHPEPSAASSAGPPQAEQDGSLTGLQVQRLSQMKSLALAGGQGLGSMGL